MAINHAESSHREIRYYSQAGFSDLAFLLKDQLFRGGDPTHPGLDDAAPTHANLQIRSMVPDSNPLTDTIFSAWWPI